MHRTRTVSRPAPRTGPATSLTLTPALVRSLSWVFAVVLVALGAGHVLYLSASSVGVLNIFDLSNEQSFGTWVGSTLHLGCAVLSAVGALLARQQRSRWAPNWWLLALVFLVMSVDETAAGHDRLVAPLQDRFDTTGALLYPWVVVAGVLGLVFLVVQLRFLRSLGRTGRDLVLAALVFVGGAAGLEMVEGVVASPGGPGEESLLYALLVMAEELMEVGALMWVVAILLTHLIAWLDRPRVVLVPSGAAEERRLRP